MYVPQTDACTMPNGLIPAPADVVAARRAAVAADEAAIQRAQRIFAGLLQRRDMGPIPRTLAPANLERLKQWPLVRGPVSGQAVQCYPASVETAQLTTMPAIPKMPSLTTAHGVDTPLSAPSTGNPCLDVELGYALQSQLSPAMLWKCTQKGYFKPGVRPTVAPVLALANENRLAPLPDQDVPDFDESMLLGLGALPDNVGTLFKWLAWGAGGLFLYAAWKGTR